MHCPKLKYETKLQNTKFFKDATNCELIPSTPTLIICLNQVIQNFQCNQSSDWILDSGMHCASPSKKKNLNSKNSLLKLNSTPTYIPFKKFPLNASEIPQSSIPLVIAISLHKDP